MADRELRKPLLSHNSIEIFRTKKGNVYSHFLLSVFPNQQNEGSFYVFDARLLPRRYQKGLSLAVKDGAEWPEGGLADPEILRNYIQKHEAIRLREEDAVREAIKRAIEDDYDFGLACEGHYSQRWRRFRRWLGKPAPKKDVSYF